VPLSGELGAHTKYIGDSLKRLQAKATRAGFSSPARGDPPAAPACGPPAPTASRSPHGCPSPPPDTHAHPARTN